MRFLPALGVVLFLCGVVLAFVAWAGVSGAAGFAFALGAFGLGIGVTVGIAQMGNWGVPADEPPIISRLRH